MLIKEARHKTTCSMIHLINRWCAKSLQSCPTLPTPWTTGTQRVFLSMGFSRQEYWSGLPFPCPGDLPDPGIEPASLESPAPASRFFTTSATCEAHSVITEVKQQDHWVRRFLGLWSGPTPQSGEYLYCMFTSLKLIKLYTWFISFYF